MKISMRSGKSMRMFFERVANNFTIVSLILPNSVISKIQTVKSVLSAKLLEAQNKGIGISVEIDEPVRDLFIEVLDFITFLSILCDNAIEATVLADKPKLSIAIFKMGNQSVIVVENSTKEAYIDVTPLKQRGFSTKGTGRGLGLANIEEILFRYDNVTLETESAQHRFVQLLSITPKED